MREAAIGAAPYPRLMLSAHVQFVLSGIMSLVTVRQTTVWGMAVARAGDPSAFWILMARLAGWTPAGGGGSTMPSAPVEYRRARGVNGRECVTP